MNKKSMTHHLLGLTVAAVLAVGPAYATDIVESTVLAFDRVANLLIIKDKTVWPLDLLESDLPQDLQAGDMIEIRYESNEDDGVRVIHSIKRM